MNKSLLKQFNNKQREVNRTTGVPLMVLLKKNWPLPNELLLSEADYKTVPCTLLIRHNGAGYAVPREFNGKKVFVTDSAVDPNHHAEALGINVA